MSALPQNKIIRMNSRKDSAIGQIIQSHEEYLARKKARWQSVKKIMRLILSDLLPKDYRLYCEDYGVTLYIPWSMENLENARKAIGSGWHLDSTYTNDDGSMTRNYSQTVDDFHINFSIIMDAQKLVSGACRKILIQEETKMIAHTTKKYKVICEDGTETFEISREEDVE